MKGSTDLKVSAAPSVSKPQVLFHSKEHSPPKHSILLLDTGISKDNSKKVTKENRTGK
jgi:hypothetical protein